MKAKSDASTRTKNRLREHKELAHANDRSTIFKDGVQHGFFRCVDHCDWVGWLPLHELEGWSNRR